MNNVMQKLHKTWLDRDDEWYVSRRLVEAGGIFSVAGRAQTQCEDLFETTHGPINKSDADYAIYATLITNLDMIIFEKLEKPYHEWQKNKKR